MPYLFSVLTDELPRDTLDQGLCYYINQTDDVQTIRATNKGICYLECLVFPKEKVLFATLSNSYLEINSSDLKNAKISSIKCNLLCI